MVAIDAVMRVGIPALAGFNVASFLAFDGGAGQSVDTAQWNIITK
jgi:hypothetical protein